MNLYRRDGIFSSVFIPFFLKATMSNAMIITSVRSALIDEYSGITVVPVISMVWIGCVYVMWMKR
jgi:hypothetical protein